jgi:hypothetical protein
MDDNRECSVFYEISVQLGQGNSRRNLTPVADQSHLDILLQGVRAWNFGGHYGPNLSGANIR